MLYAKNAIQVTVLSLISYLTLGDDHKRLTVLERQYFGWRLDDRPEFASGIGHYRNSDRLERFGLQFMDDRYDTASWYLSELDTINKTSLSRKGQVDYTILQDMLQTYLDGYEWRRWTYLTPFNWLEGNQRNPFYFVDSTPFDNRGDFENYVARLNLMPRLFTEYKTMMDEAIRLGRTSHLVSVNRVPAQIKDILKESAQDSIYSRPFYEDLEMFNTSIPLLVREDIKRRGTQAVTNVLKAYQDLDVYLETVYFNKTRASWGVGSLEGGKDFYKACLKWYLSLDLTPEELHDRGQQEVARVKGEMQKIMVRQGYGGYKLRDYFGQLEKRSDMYYDTAEDVIKAYEHIVFERIEPVFPSLFHDPPGLPVEVQSMPSDGSRASYVSGTADGIRPGIFYANTFRKWPKYTMMSAAMHETNPGHHLQISYAITTDLPEFRKNNEYNNKFRVPYAFPSYTAYMEGWALYAESLGLSNNLYQDDYELMGYYDSEVFRACRMVVDTGIHYFGWSREKSIEYFMEHTSETREGIEVEVDRYITWPGQAVAYKVGELKIKQLRQYAQDKLGDSFDVRDFHQVVLEKGPMPLTLLDDLVKEWVANFQATHEPEGEEECECVTYGSKSRCTRSVSSKSSVSTNDQISITSSLSNMALCLTFAVWSILQWRCSLT